MSKQPTIKQRCRWERIRDLGCSVCEAWHLEIHHCGTGAGGRKDHDKVIALCYDHHRGGVGIYSMGRKLWQGMYGSEQSHLDKVEGV